MVTSTSYPPPHGETERRAERRAVALVRRVADQMDVVPRGQQFRGAVGRAVIDHQHVVAIGKRPGDGPGHVVHLVIHRQGGERRQFIPQLYAGRGEGGKGKEERRMTKG